jgi:hypothetical protein
LLNLQLRALKTGHMQQGRKRRAEVGLEQEQEEDVWHELQSFLEEAYDLQEQQDLLQWQAEQDKAELEKAYDLQEQLDLLRWEAEQQEVEKLAQRDQGEAHD